MMTDPIADMLTRIRNAIRIEKPHVDMPTSNMKAGIAKALERGGDRDQISQLSAYARGMSAYLAGDYPETLVGLNEWAASGSAGDDSLKNLARSAVSSFARLVEGDNRDQTLESAANLLEKIHPPG